MSITWESFQNGSWITKNYSRITSEWFTNHQELLVNHFRMIQKSLRIAWESFQNGSQIIKNHQELLDNYFRMVCKSLRITWESSSEWFMNHQESSRITENCLRLYEMDAIYASTMPIYAVNINKMACVNSKMWTGSGYWVSADWNIAISTPFP